MINKKREIILDTETTGLSLEGGDRIIEIACLELIDCVPTGKSFQTYIKPEDKIVGEDAIKIHGLTNSFLKTQPPFKDIAKDFIKFIKDDVLIIHNASFDLSFINNELKMCLLNPIKNEVVDTVVLAKKVLGGGPVNLNALCKRYEIDISKRKIHGALLDCNLLAEVYIELRGGRQADLVFSSSSPLDQYKDNKTAHNKTREIEKIDIKPEEIDTHKKMLKNIKNPLWEANK